MHRTTTARHAPRLDLTAFDVMERKIVAVSRTSPLSEVERLLTEHRISGMPVVDEAGRAIGVVSFKDLLERYEDDPDSRPRRESDSYRMVTEELSEEDVDVGLDFSMESEDTAEDVMTSDVIHVRSDAPITDVGRLMAERSIHRVLVVDPETEQVIGIISSLGLLSAIFG